MSDELRVVYIAGVGRSGSTVVDRVLGSMPGALSLNEVRPLWHHGFVKNHLCSCGERFLECPFWRAVVATAFPNGVDVDRMLRLHGRHDSIKAVPRLLAGGGTRAQRAEVDEYAAALASLYRAFATVSGADTLIDSSKVPSRALLLTREASLGVRAVHVVRDSRAVVNARLKQKFNPMTNRTLRRSPAARTAMQWNLTNAASELLRSRMPYERVRYEDLCAVPRERFGGLAASMARPGRALAFEDERTVRLEPIHTIAGNPDRAGSGTTRIRTDLAWRGDLSAANRRLTTVLTAPLLLRYGYLPGGDEK